MKTLNVIGAGRVGRTVASLWRAQQSFDVQDVLDGTFDGARDAVAFIGGGSAVRALTDMRAAHVWMTTPPDREIAACASALSDAGVLRPGDIVFHCSGSIASTGLAAARSAGANVASVHPLKSFADAAIAARTFADTYCTAEGDPEALAVLVPAFESIGGRVSRIDPAAKTLYHAASVIVCNYLPALLEAGLVCYEKAGIGRERATRMMEPLVRETLENVFQLGTAAALTGPIARGDDSVVAAHLEALGVDERVTAVYRALGAVALDLAHARGEVADDVLERVAALLGDSRV
jgi:predicted short-subunit dehydrogenase-like oxidoreductase (DUF2520 family)